MSTLDPNTEIPKNAPLAQAHDAEQAAAVKKASDEHAKTVEAEQGQPEVTAREPGDHATERKSKKSE